MVFLKFDFAGLRDEFAWEERMRGLIVVCLSILVSVKAVADPYPKEKVVKTIKKNEACIVAIANVTPEGAVVLPSGDLHVIDPIICVWNGVWKEETVNEKTGCYLGKYNVNTGEYTQLVQYNSGVKSHLQPNGPCTVPMMRDILSKYPIEEYISGAGKQSVLAFLKKQSKHMEVIYDPQNVVTPEMLATASKSKEKIEAVKLKSAKELNCGSGFISSWKDEIQCSTPETIVWTPCNMNVDEENLKYRKAVYKLKTGKSWPDECPKGTAEWMRKHPPTPPSN